MQPLVFQHVRVFDGSRIIPDSTVVIENGLITAVGHESAIPSDAHLLDGSGKTLLPGLIDAHTHTFLPQALQVALIFGVTTELDMFTDFRVIAELRRAAGEQANMADLRSAVTLVTAPGGHGTEYGVPIPTITHPQEAQDFVDARIAEGADYIKIIYDNGRVHGRSLPTINKATMAAVVEAAHWRHKIAIVHVSSLQEARDAIEVGADGLAHLFVDQPPEPEFGRFLADHAAFVVPTLTVLESLVGIPGGTSLVADARLEPYLSQIMRGSLSMSFSPRNRANRYEVAEETIRQLKAAGVPILAGTDAPNPGTAHGVSMHRELELLVQAGLTPVEALAAATAEPARIFGLPDRGRIAPGLRADLLLVNGDPGVDIKATRDIVGVWKQGVPVDLQAYRTSLEQRRKESEQRPFPADSESGLVSDFEDGTSSVVFGHGWSISTGGGTSTAQYQVVPEGVNGDKGSLLITGTIPHGQALSWAGVIFSPGPAPWTPTNLSHKKGISFWAKGDGRTYQVMLFAMNAFVIPPSVSFVAGPDWQYFEFPYAQFNDMIDGHDLLGVLFSAVPEAGSFAFQIDDVRFVS